MREDVESQKTEWISGILLMGSFFLALLICNVDVFNPLYNAFVFYPIKLGYQSFTYETTLIHIVNDGLMALFFLLIGLEMKFHLTLGELRCREALILPGVAAAGGLIVPALIYLFFNIESKETIHGWAIPIATDTAFMLGILAFFGSFISNQMRAFIIGFSIIDDALALIILAIFYSKKASFIALFFVFLLTGLLYIMNRLKIMSSLYYLCAGFFLWIAMIESGIHGTLCGVVIALAIPVQDGSKMNPSFKDLEYFLKPLVYFCICPLFAFINSGVSFDLFSIEMLKHPMALGNIIGLFLGKQLGIFSFSYAAIKMRYTSLPKKVSWAKFYAIGILGGIGFTLSLFIGDLSFEDHDLNAIMRSSVIIASLLSATIGTIFLIRIKQKESSKA